MAWKTLVCFVFVLEFFCFLKFCHQFLFFLFGLWFVAGMKCVDHRAGRLDVLLLSAAAGASSDAAVAREGQAEQKIMAREGQAEQSNSGARGSS